MCKKSWHFLGVWVYGWMGIWESKTKKGSEPLTHKPETLPMKEKNSYESKTHYNKEKFLRTTATFSSCFASSWSDFTSLVKSEPFSWRSSKSCCTSLSNASNLFSSGFNAVFLSQTIYRPQHFECKTAILLDK